MNRKRRMKTVREFTLAPVAIVLCMSVHSTAASAAEPPEALVERYTGMFNQLRAELTAKVPKIDLEKAKTPGSPEEGRLKKFLASDAQDAKLAKFVVLHEATPKGLAEFVQQGKEQEALVKRLLADDELMKQMLVADGASTTGRGGPAQYGPAMRIYTDIQKASEKAKDGVLQRLAMAVSLGHAGSVAKKIAEAETDASVTEDALNRYLDYEKAYLGGELDPAFGTFTVWELKFLFGWGDPDGALVWGREMLRNLRPDHIYAVPDGVRYSVIVNTCVKYGSGHVVFDRPGLYAGQNIIMNGGVCGRRAAMGRFMCRSFGIPATARPSPRHGALVRWSPKGWWPNLGPGWGAGSVWGSKDLWFRAYTQARENREAFLQVKRAYWIGDVLGEKRTYRTYHADPPEGWNGAALRLQRAITNMRKQARSILPCDHSDPSGGSEKEREVIGPWVLLFRPSLGHAASLRADEALGV
ncbi:MAG: hypothetical protein QGF00_02595 [Planctomycetota bacterium]|nr:hypothetical protein [Planctomycetota bacterium]